MIHKERKTSKGRMVATVVDLNSMPEDMRGDLGENEASSL